jgi:hypothetical protein
MIIANETAELASVFPPHPLDPTNAFAEWGVTHVDANTFEEGVRGKRWTELTGAFLEHHHDALVFFGPSSMPEYLPAYLSALAGRDPSLSAMPSFLLGVLTRKPNDPRFEALYSNLTAEQRRAVARTLVSYETKVAGSPRQMDVTEALDSYWRDQTGAE